MGEVKTLSAYINHLFGLKGKVAVVIGAGGYLCGEMACALSRAGAAVAILDKNQKGLKRVSQKIKDSGGRVLPLAFDVTDRACHKESLKAILDKFNRLDCLINGAGINAPTPFFKISRNEWDAIMEVHTTGTFLGCQVFGRYMVQKKRGSIINMSSLSSGPPLSKAFTYSVAKSGIKNLTQNLAREWAPYSVRVNALRPGFFPTEWSKKHFITPGRKRSILGHTPMKRYGRPSELMGAIIWLASDASAFVTGTEVTVDGGFSAMTI